MMHYKQALKFLKEVAFPYMDVKEIFAVLKHKRGVWKSLAISHPSPESLSKELSEKLQHHMDRAIVITLESSNKNDVELYDLVKQLNPQHLRIWVGMNTVYELYYFLLPLLE